MRVYNYTGINAAVEFLLHANESERMDVAQRLVDTNQALAIDLATALFAALDVAALPAPTAADDERNRRIWERVIRGVYADEDAECAVLLGQAQ